MDKYAGLLGMLKYDAAGLIPAVIQDINSHHVLMVAYMNEAAIKMTLETGYTHFYSRSRQKLWKKGETSGHTQRVVEIYLDCDHDCLLIKVEQVVAACHTGYVTCFYRKYLPEEDKLEVIGEPAFKPKEVYNC